MKRIQHWHRARLLGRSGPRLKLLASFLILSLLTLWLGAPPAASASGKLESCQDVCSPDSNPPDFTLDVAPASQAVEQGGDITYTATISIINCYSETVTLSLSGLPGGATFSFDPETMASFGDSVLTVSTAQDTPAGDYALTVSADSADFNHQASISLTVNAGQSADPYFTVEVSPESQSVDAGDEADYVVGVEGHNGFGGTLALPVALSVSGLPDGAAATFSPDSLATPDQDRTLSVSTATDTPPGDYALTVSGDSGDLHHQINVNLTVNPLLNPSFSIAATPDSQTVQAGNSTSYAVALEALDGFNAAVSLSVSGLPSGALASFDPAALTPPAASVLSVSTVTDTPVGAYPLTISGDGGGLHREASVTLVVEEPGSQTIVSVSSDSDSVFVGQNVESEILLSNASDFYGIEFFMSYDPAVLQVVDADPTQEGVQIALGGLFPSDQNAVGLNEVNTATGKISLGVARLSPLPPVEGDGLLAVITWQAVGEGVSNLDFTHTKLASPDGDELDVISQDGAVTVGLTGELEGTVHPQGRFDHDGVEISVSPAGLQLLTDILGWFNLLVHGDLIVTARMHGYLDAQATVQLAPGAAVDLGPTTLYGGEVTGDNLIDILDLAYMGARFHGDDLSADINDDGLVDILDLVLSAANYMMTGPTDWGQ